MSLRSTVLGFLLLSSTFGITGCKVPNFTGSMPAGPLLGEGSRSSAPVKVPTARLQDPVSTTLPITIVDRPFWPEDPRAF